jgi:hypothetical protein
MAVGRFLIHIAVTVIPLVARLCNLYPPLKAAYSVQTTGNAPETEGSKREAQSNA